MAKRNWDTDPPQNAAEMVQMVNETVGADVAMLATDDRLHTPMIDSGSWIINNMLLGGYRLGRSFQYYGPEGAGKSYLTNRAIANHQKYSEFLGNDRMCGYIDFEGSYDENFAQLCGIDTDPERFLVLKPPTGDKGFDAIHTMLMTNNFQALGIDSVAAMIPKHDLHRALEDKTMGTLAKMMSDGMRKVTQSMGDCSLFWINQIREKLGVMFGSPTTSPGGKALNFYSSLTLEVKRGRLDKWDMPVIENGKEETKTTAVGHQLILNTVKNKTGGRNGATCELNFKYPENPWGWGIVEAEELTFLAQQYCHECKKPYVDHAVGESDHEFNAYLMKTARTWWSDPLELKTTGNPMEEIINSGKMEELREIVRECIQLKAEDIGTSIYWADKNELWTPEKHATAAVGEESAE